jgi:oxalate decarboxylase/phosphoglucose isomerase-like protein (cupin superfamily)
MSGTTTFTRNPHTASAPPVSGAVAVANPQGQVPEPLSFAFSNMPVTQLDGGTVKIIDSSTFKISTTIAAAEVTVEPGAIRELHVRTHELSVQYFSNTVAR